MKAPPERAASIGETSKETRLEPLCRIIFTTSQQQQTSGLS
jgi:hypothetical protein